MFVNSHFRFRQFLVQGIVLSVILQQSPCLFVFGKGNMEEKK